MEEKCWICGRTQKELVVFANKMADKYAVVPVGALEAILFEDEEGKSVFTAGSIGETGKGKQVSVNICPVCYWIIPDRDTMMEHVEEKIYDALCHIEIVLQKIEFGKVKAWEG